MGILAATPVLAALVYRAAVAIDLALPTSGYGVFSVLTATVSFPFVAPMLSLFYASGVTSDDVEAGTMPYFLTRPVSRSDFLLGKMLGTLTVALLLFVPPFVICYYVTLAPGGFREVGVRFPVLMQDVLAALLGLFAYNGLFALAGTVVRRPLLVSLFFAFGWQAGASIVPGSVRYFTVTHYLHSLLPHESVGGVLASLIGKQSSTAESVLALFLIGLASHVAALRVFARKEL